MGIAISKPGKQSFVQENPKFKIVLVGEPFVGKSSIFLRYTKNQFDYSYQPSVSVAIGNVVKKVNIPYQEVVSVVIWDIPGREEMDLRKSYYKDVDAAIVVVDVSQIDTIGLAPTWKQDVLNHAQFTASHDSSKSIPVLLLGNKADKLEERPSTNEDDNVSSKISLSSVLKEMEETAVQHGFIGSVTVSAKDGDGSIYTAIQTLVRHLLNGKMKKKDKKVVLENFFNAKKMTSNEMDDVTESFQSFPKTGIKEIDDVFKQCEEPMKLIEGTILEYTRALIIFQRSCCIADLTPSTRSSIEECIMALKEVTVDSEENSGMKCVNDGGFVKIVVLDDVIEDLPGPVSKILRFFHTKVALAAKDLLRLCTSSIVSLQDNENELRHLLDTYDDLAANSGLTAKRRRHVWIDVETNRSRVEESRLAAVKGLEAVENDCAKIKAAMLW
ncbi:uncharacterized protein LOC124442549 [Xenia sp. Carnegie-2017]|uniref:uncharacterized protein LOC124442549 n=1 Tax=Xenia sp. Carnegie-2017 TaxID=2897299 RepID=UPI001F038440|nr:uncharacterized protein LOC124442549 [Xenia sp. Carnegie-2017]